MFDVPRSIIFIQIVLLCVQAVLYFGIQILEGPAHNVETALDSKIPYFPPALFFYVLWFPLIALFPLLVYSISTVLYVRHVAALVWDIVLSCVIYVIYPTSFNRPQPDRSAMGRLMRFVYTVDFKGKNCMPSMHCSMCFLMIFTSLAMHASAEPLLIAAIILLCLLIVAATVLTKQHVIIDVISGFVMTLVCWLLADPSVGILIGSVFS